MPNITLQSLPSGNVLLLMQDDILAQKIKTLFSLTSLRVVGQTQEIEKAWELLVKASPILVILDETKIPMAQAIKDFSLEISTMLVSLSEVSEKIPYLDGVLGSGNLEFFFSELAQLFQVPKRVQIEALEFGQEVFLSERQKQILKELTLGKSNSELAEHFQISLGTLRNHLHQIYLKLHVKDKPSAIVTALRGGIVN